MRITKQEVTRFVVAVLSGVLAFAIVYSIYAYASVYRTYSPMPLPADFWRVYLYRTFVFWIPMGTFGCVVTALVYSYIRMPKDDGECRCRRCGYILKGISEPKCSECGEVI